MRLQEELYFDITAEGDKESVKKFVSYITSGVLDDFFEFEEDFIIYSDNFNDGTNEQVCVTLANDDYGIEIDDFDPEEFLDVLCRGGKSILIHGHLYDIDDEDYVFVSHPGDASFTNCDDIEFNDELDREAFKEELDERDDY